MATSTVALKTHHGDASRRWTGRSAHKRGCRRKERHLAKLLLEDAPLKIRHGESIIAFT